MKAPLVTSFYGVDVSRAFREMPPTYYDRLKSACASFFVMSEDMKRRVVAHGFPEAHVHVHPVSVEPDAYPFHIRTLGEGEELRLAAVGRFVEKKGFDDLLRALAIVKERGTRPVHCTLVGAGPLDEKLRHLAAELDLDDILTFAGLMPMEEVVEVMDRVHVLVQPSKTAADGDME
jgi:colanic acid/amylovoran biosynthesis glycosyltransferase